MKKTSLIHQRRSDPRITCSPLEPGKEEELFGFYRMHLDQGERVVKLYEWRRLSPKASGGVATFVARSGSEIVGALNAIAFDLAVNGTMLRASWQQDSIVHPRMRGKGIGKLLVETAAEGWDVVMAKGTSPPMYHLRKSVGFKDVPNSNYSRLVMSPFRIGSSIRELVANVTLYLAGGLRRYRRKAHHGNPDTSVRSLDRFACDLDSHVLYRAAAHGIGVSKSGEYLNWRYFTCPVKQYSVLEVRAGGQLVGIIVLDRPRNPSRTAWIVDMLFDLHDSHAAATLVAAAIAECRREGAASIRIFATAGPMRLCLAAAGFMRTTVTPRFTYRAANKVYARELSSTLWNFWHGDGDIDLYT